MEMVWWHHSRRISDAPVRGRAAPDEQNPIPCYGDAATQREGRSPQSRRQTSQGMRSASRRSDSLGGPSRGERGVEDVYCPPTTGCVKQRARSTTQSRPIDDAILPDCGCPAGPSAVIWRRTVPRKRVVVARRVPCSSRTVLVSTIVYTQTAVPVSCLKDGSVGEGPRGSDEDDPEN